MCPLWAIFLAPNRGVASARLCPLQTNPLNMCVCMHPSVRVRARVHAMLSTDACMHASTDG